MDLQNGVSPILQEWAYAGLCPDFDILQEDDPVGAELRQRIVDLANFCMEHTIPYSMIFSAAGQHNGKEQRYLSNTYLAPAGRVTPEVLLCGLVAVNGMDNAPTSVGHVAAAHAARQFFLTKLEEELTKLGADHE